jgi:hypothetical protein
MEEFIQWKNCAEVPWWNLNKYIKEVVVEDGVTSVSNDAFAWCSNLEKVTLADSVNMLDYQAFYACGSLKEVTLSKGLREIGQECFFGCSLTSLELPSSLKYIREEAFGNTFYPDEYFGTNTFDTLYIPAGVKEISSSSFSNCRNLSNITVDKNNNYFEIYDSVLYYYNYGNLEITFIPYDIQVLNIPEGAYEISYDTGYIFNNDITTINIPSSVESVSDLYSWDTLKEINVSEDNPYLSSENGVLYNKDKTEIISYPSAKKDSILVLPETVTTVKQDSFNYFNYLTDVYYLGSEDDLEIDDYAFKNLNIHYNASPTFSKGDVDGDGSVSCVDLVTLKKYILNKVEFSSEQLDSADINEDSKVNVIDVLELKRTLLNQ